MASQDQRNAASKVVDIMRKVTRGAQLLPFVYLVFYSAYMLCSPFMGERTTLALDGILYVAPALVILMLLLSRLLRLCVWHKTACLLPSLSQVEGFVDNNLFVFTQEEIIFINTAVGLLVAAFLIFAIRHFCYGK